MTRIFRRPAWRPPELTQFVPDPPGAPFGVAGDESEVGGANLPAWEEESDFSANLALVAGDAERRARK